ncbi:hypothetical protein H9X77_16965 [Clostridium saudiense]|nr:hypothetical protein [Clostridium saudiense]
MKSKEYSLKEKLFAVVIGATRIVLILLTILNDVAINIKLDIAITYL